MTNLSFACSIHFSNPLPPVSSPSYRQVAYDYCPDSPLYQELYNPEVCIDTFGQSIKYLCNATSWFTTVYKLPNCEGDSTTIANPDALCSTTAAQLLNGCYIPQNL
jgi:hypothetical protein